jgi:hypothetical protein
VPVLVEVAVTHFVDERKLWQIKQQEVAAIEIDLSMLRDATFAALETALFDDPSRTSWLYHPRLSRRRSRLPRVDQGKVGCCRGLGEVPSL